MTEIDQEVQALIENAKSATDIVFDFITVQHVTPGTWPNGFKLREQHSRGMALLGGLAGIDACAKALELGGLAGIDACAVALDQQCTVIVTGALSLYEPLKDYLCGLELMINQFPIVFRSSEPEEGGEEDAVV